MVASLQEQLVAAILNGFFYLSFICFYIGDVRIFMAGYPVKIAKLTIGNTYIGGVHIAVYLPRYPAMRHLFFPKLIGNEHKVSQCSVFKQKHTFLYRQEFKGQGFFI